MNIEMWTVIPDFKIRKKADVETLLKKVLIKGSDYMIKVDYDQLVKISIDLEGKVEVGIKLGDIYDLFNPIIILPDEQIVNELWKIRKVINAKFFNE